MKLIRFRTQAGGAFKLGIETGDNVYDLSSRFMTIRQFFEAYPDGWNDTSLNLASLPSLPRNNVHLGPPVDDGASVYLVGANYRKHAEEAGLDVPETPVIFMKPTTALVGPGEPICLPPISKQMDYEGELAVVIGRAATRVSKADAPKHVAGLTIVNDVTARDLQWVQLGKHRIVDCIRTGDVGEHGVGVERRDGIAFGFVSRPVPGRHTEHPYSGLIACRRPSAPNFIQQMSSPIVSAFQPGSVGTSIARLVLPHALGNAPRRSDLARRVRQLQDEHVLGEPALVARHHRRDPEREALLAEQRVAAVARAVRLDLASRGSARCTCARCCTATARRPGRARAACPTEWTHGTNSPSAPSTSRAALPMRVMIRMLAAT